MHIIILAKSILAKSRYLYKDQELKLPAGLNDARDESLVSHFTEAETGHLKLTEISTCTACKLATIAQSCWGRVFREFVQRELGFKPLFVTFIEIFYDFFQ